MAVQCARMLTGAISMMLSPALYCGEKCTSNYAPCPDGIDGFGKAASATRGPPTPVQPGSKKIRIFNSLTARFLLGVPWQNILDLSHSRSRVAEKEKKTPPHKEGLSWPPGCVYALRFFQLRYHWQCPWPCEFLEAQIRLLEG